MEWISVKDRLPIDDGKVIITWGEPSFGSSYPEIGIAYYDVDSEKFLFWFNDVEVKGFGVTHWMNVPKLPKDD